MGDIKKRIWRVATNDGVTCAFRYIRCVGSAQLQMFSGILILKGRVVLFEKLFHGDSSSLERLSRGSPIGRGAASSDVNKQGIHTRKVYVLYPRSPRV